MGALQELFKNSNIWLSVIFIILVFVIALKEIVTAISFLCEKIGIKTKRTTDKERINQRLLNLETHDIEQTQKLNEMCDNIKDIKYEIIKSEKERKGDAVATYRSTLYQMHEDFMKKGYITESGLKTFVECGKRYELAGGDDIYHDKLYPEIMSLPVK